MNKNIIDELKNIYKTKKDLIEKQLKEFENNWLYSTEEELFYELVFCILTPQSKARMAEKTINILKEKNLIINGNPDEISKYLNYVRFKNKKALYICYARNIFIENGKLNVRNRLNMYEDIFKKREWLYKNIKGIGIKEASHFLRNIGLGKEIAIIDRHVIKNLKDLGYVKDDINLSYKNYLQLEDKIRKLSFDINIPMDYLDFVFLYRFTNDIFK